MGIYKSSVQELVKMHQRTRRSFSVKVDMTENERIKRQTLIFKKPGEGG